ncbi:hypothetical protein EDD21DRAFT_430843 [Dissophora ornata]|nr:hypothetical protein EDD21DRAFT_430843 [Dissophora ornata]
MSTKPCGNCKKTVYINEKIDVESRWYHRGCFKCMAPDCNTSLTSHTFQMAALDDSVLDSTTNRPLKVLVCKKHVPMPKHSLNADSLLFKHATSTPKPSVQGLHRSMMGSRGTTDHKESVIGYGSGKINSPRSLDQGSHAKILKDLKTTQEMEHEKEEEEEEEEEDDYYKKDSTYGDDDEGSMEEGELKVHSMEKTTLPKLHQGRFTASAVSDPVTTSHVAAASALDPTMDDDSFRNIPVRHSDYEHKDGHTTKEDDDEWDDHERSEDHKQEHTLSMKDSAEHEEKSLGNLAYGSKLMDQKKHGRNVGKDAEADDKVVDDDDDGEWDAAPTDDFSRREAEAGI